MMAEMPKNRSQSIMNSTSAKKPLPSPRKRSKSIPKDVDWNGVTDPEERRRIQNRIAQRKFREKARENREKAERDIRNQEYAGNSYRIPSPTDFSSDCELSGLPWGSVNWSLAVARGHQCQSRPSSGKDTYIKEEPFSGPQHVTHDYGLDKKPTYCSSVEEAYYEDMSYMHGSYGIQTFTGLSPLRADHL